MRYTLRSQYIALIGILALAGFSLDAAAVVANWVSGVDESAFQLGLEWRNGPVGAISLLFTFLGTAPGLAIFATVGVGAMVVRRQWLWAVMPPLALLLGWIVNPVIKCTFLRQRPPHDLVLTYLNSCDRYSFPSGHAMESSALFGVLILWAVSSDLRYRYWIAALMALMPLLIGLSRVVLGVHWLSDVVGGWLAGIVIVGVAVLLVRWSAARKKPGGRRRG